MHISLIKDSNMKDDNTTAGKEGISAFDRVLFWFSTAIPDIVSRSRSDANRAKIIGVGVLFTFIYACIAWIYFWSTSVSSPWLYVPLGLFLGFGILTIDRMLIASIKAGKINLVPTAFRVVLALALGTFIAQPVILWMFKDDLSGEIAILNDQKIEERNQELLTIRDAKSAGLIEERQSIQGQLDSKYEDVQDARTSYQQEIDGTGGSKRYGIKQVAKEKGKLLEREEEELKDLRASTQPRLDSLDGQLAKIESEYQTEIATFTDGYENNGFLVQVEALQSLISKDTTGALRNRYILLLLILVMFELIPIISKIFLPIGSYDHHVNLLDQNEKESFDQKFGREKSYDESFQEGVIKQDKRLLSEFFKRSDEAKTHAIQEEIDSGTNNLKSRIKRVILSD